MKLTRAEREVLRELSLRPNGAPIRGAEHEEAVFSLADKVLICDPHRMGSALFTRITPAGRAALEEGE